MPTVPSTCLSLSSLEGEGVVPAVSDQIGRVSHSTGGPTPDPDLDDVVMVPVITGDGLGAISSSVSLGNALAGAQEHPLKPRLSLNDLSLHSPSSILGTPFDVSETRFEYPFPLVIPEPDSTFFPALPGLPVFGSPMSSYSGPSMAPSISLIHPSTSAPRNDSKSVSYTHPKLSHRDPPVPPGLAKKRRNVIVNPAPKPRTRTRSSTPLILPEDIHAAQERASSSIVRKAVPEDAKCERSTSDDMSEEAAHLQEPVASCSQEPPSDTQTWLAKAVE